MIEEFRKIQGYEDYEVSNLGNVRSFKNGKMTVIEGWMSAYGYKFHSLRKNGRTKKIGVHHLVLNEFGERRPAEFFGTQKMVARHKNAVRTDNRIENLCWGTMADNSRDRVEHGNSPFGEKCKNHKLTEAQVIEILESPESYVELGRRFGVKNKTIHSIKIGKNWAYLHRKGTPLTVVRRYRNKLDEIAVRVIRNLKYSSKSLAHFYGVSITLINMVRRRQWWAHVA